jgi:hypothetical protein
LPAFTQPQQRLTFFFLFSRSRSALPTSWNAKQGQREISRDLLPPPLPPAKRRVRFFLPALSKIFSHFSLLQSDPGVPTIRRNADESSPFRMDIDGASPNPKLASPINLRQPRSVSDSRVRGSSQPFTTASASSPYSDENDRSGADDRLADMFGQSPGDLSPIPQSRKRLLELENSPTPVSPTPPSGLGGGSLGAMSRRPFEKAATTASLGQHLRRQRSAVGLNVGRRPPLANFGSLGPAATALMQDAISSSSSSAYNKRHAAQTQDGKPVPAARKASRRSNSVADASFAFAPSSSGSSNGAAPLGSRDPNIPIESPRTLAARASMATLDGCVDYFNAVQRRSGASVDLGSASSAMMSPENSGSPIAGFRKQEAKGKALPCFNVKEDGLMRISPQTVRPASPVSSPFSS